MIWLQDPDAKSLESARVLRNLSMSSQFISAKTKDDALYIVPLPFATLLPQSYHVSGVPT